MFPFAFNPYFGRRTRIPRLDQVIPKVTTISVSDTDEVTTLGICPRIWCQLPNEGLMVFEARHTPAEASASLPVVISTTGSVSPAANSTTYSLGKVVSVSKPYDEPLPPGQFPMPMQNRRKLVDLVISCDGEQKKLSVSEDKTMMTDSTIGLTIATDKTQIVDMVKQSYNDCKVKKESVLKYDEEMRRCEDILKLLNTTPDITTNVTKDFKELDELKAEVKELKQLLQNVTTVRPEVKIETPSSEEKQIEI